MRSVNYKANGVQPNLIDDTFTFFNPKAGLNFTFNTKNTFYFSYARAHREPNRTDYEGGDTVKPEKLNDFELGWRFAASKMEFNLNGFLMSYEDQLVLTGALDDVGNPIRKNSGKSFRFGVEFDMNYKLTERLSIRPNITVSENKIVDFVYDDGTNLVRIGKTDIAYSPKIIAGNSLSYSPINNLQLALLSKYVGKQFLSSLEDQTSKLDSYFIQDFNVNYTIKTQKIFNSINFSLLVNNIVNTKYVSNGADYGYGYVYYYPQAGRNFLVGMNLKF